jgi:predicted HicB family RNase H-like nuclease
MKNTKPQINILISPELKKVLVEEARKQDISLCAYVKTKLFPNITNT